MFVHFLKFMTVYLLSVFFLSFITLKLCNFEVCWSVGLSVALKSFEDFEVCWAVGLYICMFHCLLAHSRSQFWS